NHPLTLYHGTAGICADDIERNGISVAQCKPGRDFGVAFYTTTNLTQAIKFANDTYRTMRALHVNNNVSHPNPVHAAVIEYTIDRDALGSLASLSFVLANDDWREF